MPYQEEVHNDPRYWEKPDQFFPEHFIDDKGNLITKKRGFLPFSLGNNYFLYHHLCIHVTGVFFCIL